MWWDSGLHRGLIIFSSICQAVLIGFAQVTVSNPFEVAKTRLQLQGELSKGGGVNVYNNAIDVLAKTWRNEGIRGLQRGLGPAVSLSCCAGTRIDTLEL